MWLKKYLILCELLMDLHKLYCVHSFLLLIFSFRPTFLYDVLPLAVYLRYFPACFLTCVYFFFKEYNIFYTLVSKIPDMSILPVALSEVIQSTTCDHSCFPLAWVCPKSFFGVHQRNTILFQQYFFAWGGLNFILLLNSNLLYYNST